MTDARLEKMAREWLLAERPSISDVELRVPRLTALLDAVEREAKFKLDQEIWRNCPEAVEPLVRERDAAISRAEAAEAQCARMRKALECIKTNAEIDGHGPLIDICTAALASDAGAAILEVVRAAKAYAAILTDTADDTYGCPEETAFLAAVERLEAK